MLNSDPIIRDNSDVTLKNAVVILDEAHNVEDVCREAVSFSFTEREIVGTRADLCKKGFYCYHIEWWDLNKEGRWKCEQINN